MKTLITIIATGFIVLSCSSTKVTSDYDKSVNFKKYSSFQFYGWADNTEKMLNRFDKERIENAFINEFRERGIAHVEQGGDLLVTLYLVVEEKADKKTQTTGYGYPYGYSGWGPAYGWGPNYSTTFFSEDEYVVGTLVVDVFDNDQKLLIWEGIGKKVIEDEPEE